MHSLRRLIDIINESTGDRNQQLLAYLTQNRPRRYSRANHDDTAGSQLKPLATEVLPRSTWLCHFTDHAEQIVQHGFTIGETEPAKLGMTSRHDAKPQAGYNFAFLVDEPGDWLPYIVNSRSGAVVFQSAGVYTRHLRDRFNQVIFWGGYVEPSDIHAMQRVKRKWLARDHNGEVLFQDTRAWPVAWWITRR